MQPTIESVVRKFKKLVLDGHIVSDIDLQEYDGRQYHIDMETELLLRLLGNRCSVKHGYSLFEPCSRFRDEIWYLLCVNRLARPTVFSTSQTKLRVDLAMSRCQAVSLFEQFVAFSDKLNETKLSQHFTRTLKWLAQIDKHPLGFEELVKFEKAVVINQRKQFKTTMSSMYSHLINTYLGLLPLNLDVWTVLFIVSQLPEFDLVYDGAKVRIYERMRMFREKCSIIKTIHIAK